MSFGQSQQLQQQSQLQLESIIITQQAGHVDQWIRPYELNLQMSDLSKLEQAIANKQKRSVGVVNKTDVSNILPDIYMPKDNVVSKAEIPYGWGEERGSFLLRLIEPSPIGYGYNVYLIQGYTSYWGISDKGYLDPNMLFYTNSVMKVHVSKHPNGEEFSRVVGYFTVIFDPVTNIPEFRDQMDSVPRELKVGRPEDYLSVITEQAYIENLNLQDQPGVINLTVDTTSVYRDPQNPSIATPVVANKDYNNPNNMLTDVINSVFYTQTPHYDNNIIGYNVENNEIYDQALSTLSANTLSIYDIPFFNKLSDIKFGQNHTYFTSDELKQLVTNEITPERIKIIKRGSIMSVNSTESAELHSPNIETKLAILAIESISSLLTKYLISGANISLSNASGVYDVVITEPVFMFNGLQQESILYTVMEKIKLEIMPTLTYSNQIQLLLNLTLSYLSDAKVMISVDNNPLTPYIVPLYADNTISGLVTNDDVFKSNVTGIRNIGDVILGVSNI